MEYLKDLEELFFIHRRNDLCYNIKKEEMDYLERAVRTRSGHDLVFAIRLDKKAEEKINQMASNLEKLQKRKTFTKPSSLTKTNVAKKYLAGLMAEAGGFCPELSQPLLQSFDSGDALSFQNNPLELYILSFNLRRIYSNFFFFIDGKTDSYLQREINDLTKDTTGKLTIKILTTADELSNYENLSRQRGVRYREYVTNLTERVNSLREQQEKQ